MKLRRLTVVLLCALAAAAVSLGWRPLAAALLPWQAASLRALAGPFDVRQVALRVQGLDVAVAAHLRLAVPLARSDGRRVAFPQGADLTVSLSAAKGVLALAVLLLPLLAWPLAGRREAVWRAALGGVAGVVLVALDVPLVMLGQAWSMLHDEVAGLRHSAAEPLARFLESGGRIVLALAASLCAVAAARWLADGHSSA